MPELSFDRVDNVEEPPANSTPQQVKEFYQAREKVIVQNAKNAIASVAAGQPPRPASNEVRIERPTDPPPAPKSNPAQSTLTEAARNVVAGRPGNQHFTRYEGEIRKLMETLIPEQQVDASYWQLAYNNVVGTHMEELTKEAVAASKAPVPSAEPASAAPTPAPAKPELTEKQKKMISGLNLTPEKYFEAQERIDKGVWPVTISNQTSR